MDLTQKKDGSTLTIFVSGRVDTVTAPELEKYINENVQDVTDLILDLNDMPYTSSAGLRVILKAQKLMNSKGSMITVNVKPDVMEIFEMTGFTDILNIK